MERVIFSYETIYPASPLGVGSCNFSIHYSNMKYKLKISIYMYFNLGKYSVIGIFKHNMF